MLDLAKLDKGAMELESIQFCLLSEIEQVAGASRRRRLGVASRHGVMFAVSVSTSVLASRAHTSSDERASENVQLVLDFAPSVPMFVVGDPLRLKQVCLPVVVVVVVAH